MLNLSRLPIQMDDQIGEASIVFGSSNRVLLSTESCYTVFWEVESIYEVYLNERGQVGQGERELCYDAQLPPTLRVIFEDLTEKTYSLELVLIYDLFEFWVRLIGSLVVLHLLIFLETLNPISWLRRLKSVLMSHPLMWFFMLMVSVGYWFLVSVFATGVGVVEHSDSRYYLQLASHISVVSFFDWQVIRPPIVPILYSLLNQDLYAIGMFQLVMQTSVWFVFGWAIALLMQVKVMRILSLGVILGFALTTTIFQWWHVLLTESIAVSLTVLLMTIAIGFIRYLTEQKRPLWHQVILGLEIVLILFIWLFSRDLNVYVTVIMVGLSLFCLIFFRSVRQHIHVFLLIVLVFAVGLSYIKNRQSVETNRWKFPLTNVIIQRVLLDEEALNYFLARELPVSDALLQAESAITVYPYQGEFEAYNQWLDTQGRQVFMDYLVTYPVKAIVTTILERDAILLIHDDLHVYSQPWQPTGLQRLLTDLFFIHGSHLYGLTALVALFVGFVAVKHSPDWRWVLPVGLLLLVYPIGFITFHGDSMEVERHSLPVAIYWRLGFWILFLLAMDTLLKHRSVRRVS